MSFLLDTNVISELRRARNASPSVIAWFRATESERLSLSVMTIFELERGAVSLARHDPPQAQILRSWIDGTIRPMFGSRVLPVDATIAERCASLHVPNKRPLADSLIAATALVHNLIVVTRNVADFKPMGVQLVDPWGT